MSRGDRRDPIFKNEEDHRLFMETLDQACEKTGWQVHAWCLMSNHFHLVIELRNKWGRNIMVKNGRRPKQNKPKEWSGRA